MSQADMSIKGTFYARSVTCSSFTPPAGCIGDAAIAAGANVEASKIMRRCGNVVAQKNGAANAAQRQVVAFIVGATGTLLSVIARNTTATTAGSSTTVQVKVNGSNVLSSAITLDDTDGTTAEDTSSFTSDSLVAGDVVEVDISVSGGAPGQGVAVGVFWDEEPN